MDLTKVLIILIAVLILITLYVIIKLNKFMRAILNEDKKEFNINTDFNVENEIENSKLQSNSQNLTKLKEINSEINIEEAQQFVQHTLISMFRTIEEYNMYNISYYSDLIYYKLKDIISKQKELQQNEYFKNVNIDSVYLVDVEESKGYTSLVFEINISLKHYIQQNTEIIFGNPDETIADRYIISIVYVDNVAEMEYETKRTNIHGVNCPNCGESLRELKDIECMVCGNDNSSLIEKRFVAIDFNRGWDWKKKINIIFERVERDV